MTHAPVLLREVIATLAPRDGETHVDGTFGAGGYSRAILESAQCRVIGIDRDPDALTRAQALSTHFGARFEMRPGVFGAIETLVPERVDGAVLDIGVSSFQLDEATRGFSLLRDGPLDMRMGADGPSAACAVAHLSEAALADIIFHYGEEPQSRRIARAIIEARKAAPIESTAMLAAIVEKAVGGRKGARIHPATQTFQALRILVNDELGELARALLGAEQRLKPGGRLIVVTFHSLEDRLVKQFFAARAREGEAGSRYRPAGPAGPAPSFALSFRKPLAPSEEEMRANPRARSAKLRAGVRTSASAHPALTEYAHPARALAEWEKLT
jgi:16S rRNA (cytosine1402-N4)-methyltransferase